MKVLIIGGTRYLGPRLVKRLLDCGHEPVLFNRGKTNAPMAVRVPIRRILGDRNTGEELLQAVNREQFDAVVDTLVYDAKDAARAVQVFSGRVGKYVMISSVACYGRLKQVPADEGHPFVDPGNPFPGSANVYAVGKRDAEAELWQAWRQDGFPVIVIRPSVSYGYGRLFGIWGYSSRHVDRIRKGKEVIVPDSGEGLVQPVHIDDEAAIIERCLVVDKSAGEAFNCAGPAAVPLWQYFRAHGEVLAKMVRLVEIPALLLEGFDPVRCVRASQNLIYNHAYDVAKLERLLGFKHAFDLEDGLKDTIRFQDRWNLIDTSDDTDPEDTLIRAFRSNPQADLRKLGETVRLESAYTPPAGSPLSSWAPESYAVDRAPEVS